MVLLLQTLLPVISGILLTHSMSCARADFEDKKRPKEILMNCTQVALQVLNLQSSVSASPSVRSQVLLYKELATKVSDNYNLGLRFPNEVLQVLASMRKMSLNYNQDLFSTKELMALELALISPSNKSGILDSIKTIKKDLSKEASIGVGMVKNLVEHPEYEIVLLKFMILILEIHKLLEPTHGHKLAELIPRIMYAHPDPVLHDFKTNKPAYESLIQKYRSMLDEAATYVDFLLKLSLPNFVYHMNQELLASSLLRKLTCGVSGFQRIKRTKLLRVLDFLNLIGDKYSFLFVNTLFRIPVFLEACEEPMFRQKLIQKLVPNPVLNSGGLPRTLEQIENQYREMQIPFPKAIEPIVLPREGADWLKGERKYREAMLEDLTPSGMTRNYSPSVPFKQASSELFNLGSLPRSLEQLHEPPYMELSTPSASRDPRTPGESVRWLAADRSFSRTMSRALTEDVVHPPAVVRPAPLEIDKVAEQLTRPYQELSSEEVNGSELPVVDLGEPIPLEQPNPEEDDTLAHPDL